MVAGLDFSTKALDVVLLDDDTDTWIWKTFPIHGRTPFDRAQDIRFTLPKASWWEERQVRLIAVEEPRGHQQLAMCSLFGAIVARLPRGIPAVPFIPQEWKKPFTGNGNAPKELVRRCALEHGLPDDMAQDAYDAYAIAWVAREKNTRAEPAPALTVAPTPPPRLLARPATPALDQLAREETRGDAVQAGQDEEPLQDQREMEVEDVRGGGDGGEQLHGPPRLPVPRVRPLARDQQTVDQLAINEELESFDEWVRGLSAEGGQAR